MTLFPPKKGVFIFLVQEESHQENNWCLNCTFASIQPPPLFRQTGTLPTPPLPTQHFYFLQLRGGFMARFFKSKKFFFATILLNCIHLYPATIIQANWHITIYKPTILLSFASTTRICLAKF